jgi:hypothetical protein
MRAACMSLLLRCAPALSAPAKASETNRLAFSVGPSLPVRAHCSPVQCAGFSGRITCNCLIDVASSVRPHRRGFSRRTGVLGKTS